MTSCRSSKDGQSKNSISTSSTMPTWDSYFPDFDKRQYSYRAEATD